jgi:hypothetical protein
MSFAALVLRRSNFCAVRTRLMQKFNKAADYNAGIKAGH